MSIPRVILTNPEDWPDWLDRSPVNAYWTAEYRVFISDEAWILRNGEPHPALAMWMQKKGFSSLAIITAYNPGSVLLEESENRRRNVILEQMIQELGLPYGPALNQAPDGGWQEPGFWVAGIGLEATVALGREFRQAAICWVHRKEGGHRKVREGH